MRLSVAVSRRAFEIVLVVLATFPVPAALAQRSPNTVAAAPDESRIALVIGNSAYKDSPLRNPGNDAADIAAALRELGWKVTLRTNAGRRQMVEAVREFGSQLRKGGVGLFYFAGHGVQSKGRNFLVPVGAAIDAEADLEFETMDANMVLAQMDEAGNRVNIVVLDACRNNPFARNFRSASRGLAQMEAATGTYLAYATAPGSVAADGDGRNGIFTKNLLASLKDPNSRLEDVFKRVRVAVSKETSNKQVPWESSSLTEEFYFQGATKLASSMRPTGSAAAQTSVPAESAGEGRQEISAGPIATAELLATVNGVQISRSRAELVVQQRVKRGAQENDSLRKEVREALINNELLIQEAERRGIAKIPEANRSGIDKKTEVQQQMDLSQQEVVVNALVAEYLRTHPVSDADIQKEYERAKVVTGDREFRARHILLATEDDAKSVLADLKKGGRFDEIARKRSLDEGTRPKGGDLDWQVPGNFDKAFSDALVKLEKGKMTDAPVRSRFGFHIIQVDDERPVHFPPLTQVTQQIQQRLVGQKVDALIRDLRSKARIE